MMLRLTDVHSYYGPSHVLQGVSMEVKEKEIVCLLGRNGVGKTTTLKSIMGIVQPRSGKIEFEGREITRHPSHEVAKIGVGYVPQGRRLFPTLTVHENLMMGMSNLEKASDEWKRDRQELVFSLFPILKERANQMAITLSGGEQQMLAIGRALMGNNKLFLLDEPSEGLAEALALHFGKILTELRELGITLLLVEQNARLALNLSDRGYIMEKGKIFFEGAPKEIRSSKETVEKLGI